MYTITAHATMRMRERGISPEELCEALGGRVFEHHYGTRLCYSATSRIGVIFNPSTMQIVTVFRLKKKQIKKWCSR